MALWVCFRARCLTQQQQQQRVILFLVWPLGQVTPMRHVVPRRARSGFPPQQQEQQQWHLVPAQHPCTQALRAFAEVAALLSRRHMMALQVCFRARCLTQQQQQQQQQTRRANRWEAVTIPPLLLLRLGKHLLQCTAQVSPKLASPPNRPICLHIRLAAPHPPCTSSQTQHSGALQITRSTPA